MGIGVLLLHKNAIVHNFSNTKRPQSTIAANSNPTIISFVSRALLARQIFYVQSLLQKQQNISTKYMVQVSHLNETIHFMNVCLFVLFSNTFVVVDKKRIAFAK